MSTDYDTMEVAGGRPVKMWTHGVPVEQEAKQQLANTAKMPFIYRHIAVMPDVHLGKGSTIGSVIPATCPTTSGRCAARSNRRSRTGSRRRRAASRAATRARGRTRPLSSMPRGAS